MLDQKLRKLDMAKKAGLDEQLMQLRKETWQTRKTIVGGDIQEGRVQDWFPAGGN